MAGVGCNDGSLVFLCLEYFGLFCRSLLIVFSRLHFYLYVLLQKLRYFIRVFDVWRMTGTVV